MNKNLITQSEQNEINEIYQNNINKGGYTNFFKHILNGANNFTKGFHQKSNIVAVSLFDYFSYLIIKNRKAVIKDENKVEEFKNLIFTLFDNKSFIVGLNKDQIKELIKYARNVKLPKKMMDKIYELVLEHNIMDDNANLLLNFSDGLNDDLLDYLNYEIKYYLKKYHLHIIDDINPIYELNNKNIFEEDLDNYFGHLVIGVRDLYNPKYKAKQKVLK